MTDPENFIENHYPGKEEWQLLESPIEEFDPRSPKTLPGYR